MTLTSTERSNVRKMFDAMDGILIDHDEATVDEHFSPDFVQHNPWALDGAAHVKEMCEYRFPLVYKRWVAQGDLAGYHGYYGTPNPLGETPLVCFDLWRVRGDKIVEHWDALMPVPDEATAERLTSGGGDGGAPVTDAEIDRNVAVVRRFLEVGARSGDQSVVDEVLADDFGYHSADGVVGAEAAKQRIAAGRPLAIERTIASGDLVVAHVHDQGDDPNVTWDIFRMADGRIAETWSLHQPIAPVEEQANTHPHF
ncbi:MAG: nuclear transport factor 2 family protein [Actinomycetota bacterium]